MTMKPALFFALGLASTAGIVTAHAQTYQWKDSTGRTVISDTPPPATAKASRTISGPPAAATESTKPAEKATAEPKTTAEKDLEFKKRQLENKEKAEKLAKEQTATAEKHENCNRARNNLAALEANEPFVVLDQKGERQIMDDSQRNQEVERARRYLTEACG